MAAKTKRGKAGTKDSSGPFVIKKYANRRLYDTRASRYVTLDNLAEMVRDGEEFKVVDAKTGEDLTHSVLTQIIFEAEAKGANMLPTNFLRHVIGFYGDSLQSLLPEYLEHTMAAFSSNQDQLREQMSGMGNLFGLQQWEEIGRRNMAMFGRLTPRMNTSASTTPSDDKILCRVACPAVAVKARTGGAPNAFRISFRFP